MPSEPRESSQRALEWCAVAAMAVAGLAMLHGRTISSGFSRLPGDLGDTRLNLLILEHGFRHLRGDAFHRDFWSPAWAFFPHPHVLAYGDNLLGDLPFYVPFRLVGLGPGRALGAFVVLCSLLNFASSALLGRRLGLSPLGAGAAAALFAFGMPRSAQLNHAQLLPQFWTPLCLFALLASWRAWRAGRLRAARLWVLGSVACSVAQVAAGIYLGDFLLLGLLALVTVALVELRRDAAGRADVKAFARSTGAAWLAGAAGGAALLSPMALAYARAREELGGRDFGEVMALLPRAASYLLPRPGSIFYGWLAPVGAGLPLPQDQTMFAGFAPLLALGWLALRRPTPLPVPRWAATAAVGLWLFTALATLRLGSYHGTGVGLWSLFHALPGLDALRALSRVAVLQLLAAGLALGIGVTALQQRGGGAWALAGLLAFAPLAENWCRTAAGVWDGEIVARSHIVAERVPADCAAFFWQGQNGTDPEYVIQVDAMSAAMELGKPTVNGYGGHDAPHWPFHNPRAASPEKLQAWMVREGRPATTVCLPP